MKPIPEKLEEWESIIYTSKIKAEMLINLLEKHYNGFDFKTQKTKFGWQILVGSGLDELDVRELYGFCYGILCALLEDVV